MVLYVLYCNDVHTHFLSWTALSVLIAVPYSAGMDRAESIEKCKYLSEFVKVFKLV